MSKTEKRKGEVKASPRKHDPKWKDSTRTKRSNDRVAELNAKAQVKGWTGISEYLTAILNGKVIIQEKEA